MQASENGGEQQVDDVVALEESSAERGADGMQSSEGGSLCNCELSLQGTS